MIRIILLVALCAITGCATTGGYEQALTSWVGSNINEVINSKHWGYPSSSFTAPDGNKVYVFDQGLSMGVPAQTTINTYGATTYATTTGGGTATFWCRTYFEVDKNENIIRGRYEGNNCTGYSYGMDPYDWVGKIPSK